MKTKGIVSKKEAEKRKQYQDYLRGEKWGGKESHKKALSYYQWLHPKKVKTVEKPSRYGATARTKQASKQTDLSKKELKKLR